MSDGTSPVIVTGMHRSGTSAVARVVNILGVDLGPEGDLLEAKPDNPDGFWENRYVVELHDDLLARLGGSWKTPPLTDRLAEDEALEEYVDRALGIVSRFGGHRPGFKDPRASLLLGLWRTIWPDAGVVVSIRHPKAVAASLLKRDGFDEGKSAQLWLRYTSEALAAVPDPVVVVFEDLLSSPETSIRKLASSLGLDDSAEAVSNAVDTINPSKSQAISRDDAPATGPMTVASWLYDHIGELSPELISVIAAGAREPVTLQQLRFVESDLQRVVAMSDQFHEELKKTQGDWKAAREEADHWSLVAEKRLEALEREERSRQGLAIEAASLEQELTAMREEVAWRRAIQYRFQKVLGKRGLRVLSGWKPDR